MPSIFYKLGVMQFKRSFLKVRWVLCFGDSFAFERTGHPPLSLAGYILSSTLHDNGEANKLLNTELALVLSCVNLQPLVWCGVM